MQHLSQKQNIQIIEANVTHLLLNERCVVKRMTCLKRRPRPVWTHPSWAHRRASGAEPWSTPLVGEHMSAAESLGPLEVGSLGFFYSHQSTSCQAPNPHPAGTEEQPADQKQVKCVKLKRGEEDFCLQFEMSREWIWF